MHIIKINARLTMHFRLQHTFVQRKVIPTIRSEMLKRNESNKNPTYLSLGMNFNSLTSQTKKNKNILHYLQKGNP